jgi:NAD(P)-dependent dehydrogenase (short-subunit alcohol dehydrogenase family)
VDAFRDKVAIVTGGASGIGRALCEALAREGASVVVADVRPDGAEAVARGIAERGGKATAVVLDVRDAAAVRALVDETASRSGRIDYLFNNAGIAVGGDAQDVAPKDWEDVLDVNLKGVVNGVLAAYPLMVRQGFGHIVNTASLAGLGPAPGTVSYAASKHAVVGLSTSLRAEAADLGVRVSVVCPGLIDTPIFTNSRYVGVEREDVQSLMPFRPIPAPRCAEAILRGVRRNRSIIVVTAHAKVIWWLARLSPRIVERLALRQVRKYRQLQGGPRSAAAPRQHPEGGHTGVGGGNDAPPGKLGDGSG